MKKVPDKTTPGINDLLAVAQDAALEAGAAVMNIYHTGWFGEESKEDASPLTVADKRSHAIITRNLAVTGLPVQSEEGKAVPYSERKDREYYWLIDPLDGTREFINRNGEFTINIALVCRGKPVAGVIYAPCINAIYTGSKESGVYKNENGVKIYLSPQIQRKNFSDLVLQEQVTAVVSRSHHSRETENFLKKFRKVTMISKGSSLKFMMLAENLADIYPRLGTTMEWDTAAAHAILNAGNRGVYLTNFDSELVYNKPNLENPHFVAF